MNFPSSPIHRRSLRWGFYMSLSYSIEDFVYRKLRVPFVFSSCSIPTHFSFSLPAPNASLPFSCRRRWRAPGSPCQTCDPCICVYLYAHKLVCVMHKCMFTHTNSCMCTQRRAHRPPPYRCTYISTPAEAKLSLGTV